MSKAIKTAGIVLIVIAAAALTTTILISTDSLMSSRTTPEEKAHAFGYFLYVWIGEAIVMGVGLAIYFVGTRKCKPA